VIAWVVFVVAAFLEVGGDAIVRKGLRGGGLPVITLGLVTLAFYGLVVNIVKWDFSKLLGVYVAVFAVCSMLVSKVAFKEQIPRSTWIGIALIVAGGLWIQFGQTPVTPPAAQIDRPLR